MVVTVDAKATLFLNKLRIMRVEQVETAILARLFPISIAESEVVKFSEIEKKQ